MSIYACHIDVFGFNACVLTIRQRERVMQAEIV